MLENRLKEIRKIRKLTQKQVAEQLNIAQTTLSTYEVGTSKVDIEMLVQLADLYHVSVDELLGHTHPNVIYVSSLSKEAQHVIEIMQKLNDKEITKIEAYAQSCLDHTKE